MAAVKIQHKNCLPKYSTEENNKHVICRPGSVRIGKNCALGLGYGLRYAASGRTQDLWHSPFPLRTSRPANNIYILYLGQVLNRRKSNCIACLGQRGQTTTPRPATRPFIALYSCIVFFCIVYSVFMAFG